MKQKNRTSLGDILEEFTEVMLEDWEGNGRGVLISEDVTRNREVVTHR